MRINTLMGVVVALSLLMISHNPLYADVRQGTDVVIAKDEVIEDDVYIFAQTATINGTIKGDLVVFAQQVNINGSVEGDVFAAAQQIQVSGNVSDDARIAGQVLTLQEGADIGDDLVAAGYSLENTATSRIGGDAKYAGYQSVFAGRVEQKVDLASANSQLSGSFGDDVRAIIDGGGYANAGVWTEEFPSVPRGLTVTESADIAGNLSYQSASEASIDPAAAIEGEVERTPIESEEAPPTMKERGIAFAKQFFALLFVGLLVVYGCPKWTGQVVNNVQKRPIASLLWGVLSLIAVIAGAVLLLVATIAVAVLLGYVSLNNLVPAWVWLGLLSTALMAVSFWVFSAWVTKVIVSAWAGNRIVNGPEWTSKQRILSLALGALILCVLTLIPVVGSIVGVAVVLMGVGSSAIWLFSKTDPLVPGKQEA